MSQSVGPGLQPTTSNTTAQELQAEQLFHSIHYMRHNERRLEHLASLGLDLVGKSVLEIGAGIGDHTIFFLDRDCRVLAVEPRPENCTMFRRFMALRHTQGYERAGNATLMRCDVESMDQFITEIFDVVYCYGLLYHVRNPLAALTSMAARCKQLLLLGTCVSFGAHEAINLVEEPEASSQAFHQIGCRPTRSWLFNRLKDLFPHVYVPRTQPAHEEFPRDWTAAPPREGFSRAVFVASRSRIVNPMLLDYLPDRQSIT